MYVQEGERVRAGQPLLRMSSMSAAALTSSAAAAARSATFQAFEAQLEGRSIGSAAASEEAARNSSALAREAQASLVIKATEQGTVVTPHPGSLLYQQVAAGEPLLTLAGMDAGAKHAADSESIRLFVPAEALRRAQPGAEVALSLRASSPFCG